MTLYATAGAKLYIGSAITLTGDDLTEADFTGETWVEIKQPESLGSIGDTAQELPFDDIGVGRTKRLKGQRSAGTMEVVCGIDYADPGQVALHAAEKADDDFAFRLVFDDAPSGGTPSERLFAAMVGGASEQFDTANNVMKLNASLWVNSNVVRVDAAGA
ncbi:hypothetical protein GCM10011415_06480 [Salipiger pallidus]|uniref:Uncharacterized protein n=1 Tax=Salipiger pallidus TaxID=1775170 RepID=A0A8J3EFW3_9RHOB|nr:hypothetical protein [Salipiger pallidus]GGG62801.1 hypothetical protein GCM10011415_06480 [Salipiger pallidus]